MQIEVNGVRLEYEIQGPQDGPALVLIRGLGSQMVQWPNALLRGFADCGFRVVTFDNRDAGLSGRCPAPGVSGDADDIIAQLAVGTTPAHAYTLHGMARDIAHMTTGEGIVTADCQFCSAHYEFDPTTLGFEATSDDR